MAEDLFLKYYGSLNTKQREAVDTIEGPVMVVAGPGTGKTQILTLRIANILRKTDTQPEQVLALTFTDAGVSAMRKRLFEIMGVTAYRVPIFTFHGFCNEVIARFGAHFPDLVGSRAANEVDRIGLLQKIFDTTELESLASLRSPYHYVTKVLKAISLLKREALSADDLRQRLKAQAQEIASAPDYRHEKGAHKGKVKGEYLKREEEIVKNTELALLYEKYEAALAEEKLYDFDDMILSVVHALEHDEQLRLIVQEEYQYVLADEHQDANGAQNKVLEQISSFHAAPNLFIVGDSKQAIYRFQGASLENFLYFHRRFPEAVCISLEDNYRSTQTILDSAHTLLYLDPVGPSKVASLVARAQHEEKQLLVTEYTSSAVEAAAIATEIKERIRLGTAPEQIALFARTNGELALYAQALILQGVAASVETKDAVLDDPHIEKLVTLLRAALGVGEDGPLLAAMHLDCFAIPELDIFLLAREANRKHVSVWRLLQNLLLLQEAGIARGAALQKVATLVATWAKLGANDAPAMLLSTIATESQLLAQIIACPDGEAKLQKFEVLLDYLAQYTRTHRHARLGDVAQLMSLLDAYNVLEVRAKKRSAKVQIMTAHRAKGLEYDVVYIANATEGGWSGGRSRIDFKLPGLVATTKEEEDADDRRLFFVALTRARRELRISYPQARDDGSALFPTRFLAELPEHLVQTIKQDNKEEVTAHAARLVPITKPRASESELKQFIVETLTERGLAVTGLNNYLSCPWKYFYRTLLRVPEPQAVPLMFGNAVHHTLRAYFDGYALKEEMGRQDMLHRLELELEQECFTDKELAQAKTEGASALGGYYDKYTGTWSRAIKNEYAVDALLPLPELELRLTGKLDKVEFLSDTEVRVVDYKTGKPKSRNEMEGKTKDADGDYKRQLVFYKFLLENTEKKHTMRSGAIDFVIPNKSGKYIQEEFVIEQDELALVRQNIATMVQELTSLSFWNKRCKDEACASCALRNHTQ